jgi:pilus assembly protein FimV
MQFTQRPPILSFALKTLTVAVASAVLMSGAANAAGLGKLTVLSALGQPLRAEIELTAVSGDEASGLVAKLASTDAFKVANIDFNPALLSLRFAVEQRGGRQFIRISSSQPLNEPFVDMLLELSWNNGRLVREYTFLLDPAELRATQTAQAAAPVEAPAAQQRAREDRQPARTAARPPAEAAQPAPRQARAAEQAASPDTGSRAPLAASKYRVKPGDTLGRIAAEIKPVDISLDMMLVALYRANPDAFIGNNMNRLKSGQILSVPDSDALHGTGAGEAHGLVVAHAADFNAYRNKLAGQVATSAPVRAPQAGQSAAGKVTTKVEERPTAANESQDQLRLSKALPSQSAGARGVTTSTEDTIAREKALADAQARVKELEKNVNDLEKLVTVKTKAGTELAQNARQEAAPANKPAAAKPAQPKAVPIAPKKAAPAPEPSLVETLMDNLNYVGAGAAVLLLAAFGLSRRRKPEARKGADEPSILLTPAEQGQSLFAETGGQNIDTNNSVFNSSFAPSASQLDTNEVDPVAEADVYIAYGRDAQAEEILKEALRVHPERYPVRLKLLEIYAARKDQRAFETQASELYSLSRGEGDEWSQAAALGLSIDPLNPLYASAAHGQAGSEPTSEERGQQALLAQQLEQSFRSGESHAADAGLGLADTAPTALPGQPAARTDDDHVLDFDLGGLSFEPVDEPAAAPVHGKEEPTDATAVPDLDFDMAPFAPAAAPAAQPTAAPANEAAPDDGFDLAFDMDFDKPAAEQAQPEPSDDKAEDDLALDLSLGGPATDVDMATLASEFDLPELPAAPADTAPATELKDPLFDLDAMNFDLPETQDAAPAAEPETAAPAPAPAPAAELKDPLFDLDAMNFDLPENPAAPADAAEELPALEADSFAMPETPAEPLPNPIPRFDMSGIDLDLPPSEAGDEPLPEVEMAGGGEMSAAHMEMETKLDLAIAYQEIGDKEGARELLDEVIKGGSSEQVNKANAMRAKLA